MMRYWLISLLLVAICLGGYSAALSGRLKYVEQENKALVAAVESRDATITGLKDAASADRRVTEEQLGIEQQKRTKADAENKTLRRALESSDCDRHRMSDDVINILRK
ncbi:DUF2570 family protein [Serratia sp. UGAL515B_01]|uniref:DUF2570 family protein n=1 Tax=Serratia sp. UGAL515B_01 TaxID=2986763 RepID=UPI002952A769|nr:DUF2570 family protein [Serratia sp. UGAL515B_01]WON77822.1 DUF2570 domain-containing protein [Serratia sp. UGAL515B_01]